PTRSDLGQNICAKRGSRQLRNHVGNLGWKVATAPPECIARGRVTARTSGGVIRTRALAQCSGENSDEALTQGLCDGLRLGVDLQLFVDMSQVERDGIRGNAHRARRGLVVVPLDHQFEQLRLLWRQMAGRALRRPELPK